MNEGEYKKAQTKCMRLLYEDLELYYTVHKDKYVDNNSEYAFSYVDS